MNNKELFEKSLKYVPGGVHSPVRSFKGLHTTPRFIKSGKGAHIIDEEGNDEMEFLMDMKKNPSGEKIKVISLINPFMVNNSEMIFEVYVKFSNVLMKIKTVD